PEQGGEQEGRGDWFALGNPLVGIDQCLANQCLAVARVALQRLGAGREQRGEQVVLAEQVEGDLGLATEEQLEYFLEQSCRRNVAQQGGEAANRGGGVPLDVEVQLGGKAYRAQHAYRVFLVALLGVAD